MATVGVERDDGQQVLASFDRRNRDTRAPEQLRVLAGPWNGKHFTHLRLFWQARRPTPGDDGWRPTRTGVVIREQELDEVIAALERVRRVIHAEGRSTGPVGPGGRDPRARPAGGPGRGPTPGPRPAGPMLEGFDEFSEYRR